MSQAGCQIHPALQPAHPARFSGNDSLLPPPGRATISAVCYEQKHGAADERGLTRITQTQSCLSVFIRVYPWPFLLLHSTTIGPRTGGVLRIRNISGMITRNRQPITQNASAKASIPDCFNSVPYIKPCARAAASVEEEPAADRKS